MEGDTDKVKAWLDRKRDAKEFHILKQIRDHCRVLLAVKNKDWFKDRERE